LAELTFSRTGSLVFGPLYSYGLPVLEHFRPKAFIAENVGGMRSANEGKAFKKILNDLKECGYRLTPHLYKFEQYGVPQSRHRVVIVGIRDDLGVEFKVPEPTNEKRFITCKAAIENPPINSTAPNHELTRQSPAVVERLSFIKEGQNAWTADLPQRLQLNVKGAKLSQIYKRLDSTLPAYTITGSGGGGTHVYHWRENRALTNRERARLQAFPDHFVFQGSKENVRRQIGMAVPPIGAKHVFLALSKTLNDVSYDSVPANLAKFLD
jgi:DNA (cytosine-5)-methyltransferase 1